MYKWSMAVQLWFCLNKATLYTTFHTACNSEAAFLLVGIGNQRKNKIYLFTYGKVGCCKKHAVWQSKISGCLCSKVYLREKESNV